jgi:hypothetical protein
MVIYKSLHTPPHVAKGHVFKGKRKRIFKEQLKHPKQIVDE